MATSTSLPLEGLVRRFFNGDINRRVNRALDYLGSGINCLFRPSAKGSTRGNGQDRESQKNGQDYDSLLRYLDESKHLPPSLIRRYFGEEAVLPLIFVDAAYMGEGGRDVGKSNFYHFLNTIIRPDYWELGFSNNEPKKIISIATHDTGEDLADSIGGNYAVTRLVGELFGSEFEGSSQALTNFRGTLYKQLESGLYALNATPLEVTKKLNELQRRAGDSKEQLEAYNNVINGLKMYVEAVPYLTWKQPDKDEAIEFANSLSKIVERLAKDLLPKGVIKEKSEPIFESLKGYANDKTSLEQYEECQIPFDIPSILMHNLQHLQYRGAKGSYLGDLLKYAMAHTSASDKSGLVTILAKPQENVDNLRIDPDNSVLRQHMEYDKAINISRMGGEYIQHLDGMPEDRNLAYLVFKFQKSELLQRVVTDIGKAVLNRDTVFDEHRDWLIKRFAQINDYVGDEVQNYSKEQLKRLALSSVPKIAETSIRALEIYGSLTRDTELTKVADSAARRWKRSKIYAGKLLI